MIKTLLKKQKHNIQSILFIAYIFSCGWNCISKNFSGYKTTTVSHYANKFDGNKTSGGETYKHSKLTASNKTLPFGTLVKIINMGNGKSVIVKVKDRGPLKPSLEFDLNQAAFKKLANLENGIVKVKYRILK